MPGGKSSVFRDAIQAFGACVPCLYVVSYGGRLSIDSFHRGVVTCAEFERGGVPVYLAMITLIPEQGKNWRLHRVVEVGAS